MNEHHDDADLRRAMRSALGDIVAKAPTADETSRPRLGMQPPRGRRPILALAAGFIAAAGLLGLLAIANRSPDQSSTADPTEPLIQTPASSPIATQPATTATLVATATTVPTPTTTVARATTPGTGSVVAGAAPAGSDGSDPCATATVPSDAAAVQTISGDIDGDLVDDNVTLYSVNDEWHVHATSSVNGTSSDAEVVLDVDDTMTINFEDIDSQGAGSTPPVAVMAMGQGANDKGIIGNFTFLTLNTEYCIAQWVYRNQRDVDEPFQWVALQEPGHVTGMNCEGGMQSHPYLLVDSQQNADGSWRVITRRLTHDFTRAEIEFLPDQTVDDSPDFVNTYGNINGCDHPPVVARSSAPSTSRS